MVKELSLGFSSCPNDTYIFYGLVSGNVHIPGFAIRENVHDVEELNRMVEQQELDVSKVSIHGFLHFMGEYALLRSGAALGRGVGPLIVARPGKKLEDLARGIVGVPGGYTTAKLLLDLYEDRPLQVRNMVFDQIMPALARGEIDYGVIIHEGRFTYESYGLASLLDLGSWWEKKTGLSLPLGGIAIKRSLGKEMAEKIENGIRESIFYAREHPGQAWDYIRGYAQEMNPDVIQSHIDLYVNEETIRLSEEGEKAIHTLFDMAREKKNLAAVDQSIFI
jgi:1,4-dihydroxy-6-naphthoate synthase